MPKDTPIDLSIIDTKQLENLKTRQQKIAWVMEVIHENGLDKDKEFMEEIKELIEALLEEKD